jgi:hypothetical protein
VLDLAGTTSDSPLDADCKNSIKTVLFFMQHLAVHGESLASNAADANIDDNQHDVDADGSVGVPTKKSAKSKSKKASKMLVSGSSVNWPRWRLSLLELMERTINCECTGIWAMGIVPENFIRNCWKYPLSLLETKPQGFSGAGASEVAARNACIRLIVNCTTNFGSLQSTGSYAALSAAIVDSLTKHEHMCATAADIISSCNDAAFSGKIFAGEVMNDIASMNMATIPSVKNIGSFIENFAKQNPAAMASFLPVLRCQIDSQAHQIRSVNPTVSDL